MGEHQETRTQTNVPQDGASRIIRKLDSIEKKLTLILWLVGLPFLLMVAFSFFAAVIGMLSFR